MSASRRVGAALRVPALCAAVSLLTLDAPEAVPAAPSSRPAQLVAEQRIPVASGDTLEPAALSEDGRLVAFVAQDAESPQRRCCRRVFILDTSSGLTTAVSATPEGEPADGDSQAPSLSADGQVVAFASIATNLIAGRAQGGHQRVFVRDRRRSTTRTLRGVRGADPDGDAREPVLSGDGRALAFTSDARNLVAGRDPNGPQTDVFLWRLGDASVERVSLDSHGRQLSSRASHSPSLNRRGDLVAFVSAARLAPEDINEDADVYLRDVRRGLTTLVSAGPDGHSLRGASYSPALSADGRYVAFVSKAVLDPDRDTNAVSDVYVYDVESRAATLISVTASGVAANAGSSRPAISGDGGFVVYQSVASNIGSGRGCPRIARDRNLLPDVYLHDRRTGCVTRVSGSPGEEWWTSSVAPAISHAGNLVVFSSAEPVDPSDFRMDLDLFLFKPPGRPTFGSGEELFSTSR